MGDSVQNIGISAFQNCVWLTKITLGEKVSKIGKNAFKGCKKLKTITIKTKKLTDKTVGANAFKNVYFKATFKCPSTKVSIYKTLLIKKGAPAKGKYKSGN